MGDDAAEGWLRRLLVGLPVVVVSFAVAARAIGVVAAIVAAVLGPLVLFGLVGLWNILHRRRRDLSRPEGVLVDAPATVNGTIGRFRATTESLTWIPRSGRDGAIDVPIRCVEELAVASLMGPFISAAKLVVRTAGEPDREIVVTHPVRDLTNRLQMLADQ